MSKHPFRKALGLTVLYSIIIIGIFVLQFRNESIILENIGLLRMSLPQTQEADGSMSLKNSISVSFRGIAFTADDVNPAQIKFKSSQEKKNLSLVSWEKPTPLSRKFNFTYDTSVVFAVNDTSSKASLTITAFMPEDAEALSLYYKPVSGYSVTEQSKTRQLFSSRNITYTMSAAEIEDTSITLTDTGNIAMYTRYDPTQSFAFTSIPSDSVNASEMTYDANIKKYRSSIISTVTSAFGDTSTLSEISVAAYVSEMASLGKYHEAIENVPDSFKKGSRRTYFTAPYFNTLTAMNSSLVMVNENFATMVSNSLSSRSLDIFAADYIDEYILRTSKQQNTKDLIHLAAANTTPQLTVPQATGILKTYLTLSKSSDELSAALAPVIEHCVNVIASACSISSDNLILTDKDVTAGFVQTVETGSVLLEYGKLTANADYCAGGYMLINTAFAQNTGVDLHSQSEVYPYLVKNNPVYPHTVIIDSSSNETVWAWTCASSISCKKNSSGNEATLSITFKQGDSHYLIINGIKPFTGIEIYGLQFHTDSRFETYNSSGFVYNESSKTLFLKSRHKSTTEKILFQYSRPAPVKPAESNTENSAKAQTTAAE